MSNPVCIITGVGPGTGSALVQQFVKKYRVAMLARNVERLEEIVATTPNTYAYPCDVMDSAALLDTIKCIQQDLGEPAVVIHNAVAGTFGDVLSVDPKHLERNFKVNTMAMLHLIQATAPAMISAGQGAILATGNTSAYRGVANFAAFAPTKSAQRILLESAARSLGPQGIHVAFVAIDAVIDLPWTRERFADKPDDFFCKTSDIARECFHIVHQPKSSWTFDTVIRPYGENW